MRTGRVLTAHMEIEPRQHDFLGLDLGEGPKRKTLIFGLIAMTIWCALLAPFVGVPSRTSFSLYFLPPIILTAFGIRTSTRTRRRQTLTDWALGVRYALLGHQPVIRLGKRRATRAEQLPLRQRWHIVTALGNTLLPTRERPPWAAADDTSTAGARPTGRPVRVHQSTTLIGGDEMHRLITTPGRHATRTARTIRTRNDSSSTRSAAADHQTSPGSSPSRGRTSRPAPRQAVPAGVGAERTTRR